MLEKFNKFVNFLLVAFLWLFVYTFIIRFVLLINWGFDLLSYRHWQILNYHWKAGWKIDTFYEWAYVLILFTFIPLYFSMLAYIIHPDVLPKVKDNLKVIWNNKITRFAYKLLFINDEKKVEEVKKEEIVEVKSVEDVVLEKKVEEVKEERIPVEIANMRKSSGESYFNQASQEEAVQEKINIEQKVEKEIERKDENINDILNRIQGFIEEDTEKSEKKEEQKSAKIMTNYPYPKIATQFEEKGYYVIKDTELLNEMDFIAVSNQKIFLINFLTENTSWVADEEFLGDSEPVWISSADSIVSPVYQTKQNADEIIEKISVADNSKKTFITMVCLLNGSIQNEDAMLNVWKEKRVYVLNQNQGSKLKKVEDFLVQDAVPLKKDALDKIKLALK